MWSGNLPGEAFEKQRMRSPISMEIRDGIKEVYSEWVAKMNRNWMSSHRRFGWTAQVRGDGHYHFNSGLHD